MSNMRTRAIATIVVSVLASAPLARADAPAPPSTSVRDALPEDARAKFDEGSKLYKESRFAEARDAFLAAHAASGDARILFNVAVCDKSLGRFARAIATLKRSLASGRPLPADYVKRTEDAIATLSRYVAFVTLESPVQGAVFSVDGEVVRENPVALDAGTHTLVATKDGHDPATQTVDVKPGEASRVVLAPSPRPGSARVTCVGVARCEVRVGDEPLGAAPVIFSRSAGSYVVRATVNGRAWGEQRVELESGRTIDVALVGQAPLVARLRVTTDRADDSVAVDGGPPAKTGAEIELAPGEHRIVVSRRDGRNKAIDVVLRDNETRDLRVALDEGGGGVSAWWFVGGGALLAGAATAVYFATRPTKFEGSAAGTLNPYVVPAFGKGHFR